ncbi:ATP-binding protein [Paenibacillus harenae]|uniref:ATP-binding protein n=1 Tax=Paenibacillus harenae TaxID=306543 RepID=UPI00041F8AE3|nr:ATP-binding protein [Paenibacillus harenae]
MIDKQMIMESNEHCRRIGLDPNALPFHKQQYTAAELEAQRSKYKEILEVSYEFADKFLLSVSGNPFLVAISDHKGYVLDFKGDPTIIDTVRQLGIVEGVRFDEEVGTNSPALCLLHKQPVQLLGEDHFHEVLHRLACYSVPLRKADSGQMLGTVSLMTDIVFSHPHLLTLLSTIVDSIEREYLLRQHNTQLQILNQVLLETNFCGAVITDAYGTIMDLNENSLAVLFPEIGSKEECLGRRVFDVNGIGEYFEQAILDQEACIGAEITLLLNQMPRHMLLDVVPIHDREQCLIRVVGSMRDITEMKSAEELLRKSEKLVFAGQVAVSIAHEIRNPMTTVRGMLQLAGKNINPAHYDLMMTELERMNAIVSEFLILGKPQAAAFKDEPCEKLLQEALALFDSQYETNGIKVRREFRQGLTIPCDRIQIKQAFLNVLKNTLEALPFGGEVSVVLDTSGSYQRISFTDNGIGMQEEVLQRIGEPFHTTRPDGNGLGLMMVNKIIASHNGKMEVSSQLGAGTTVVIFLPGKI